jgi:hypothetical protein
MSLVQPTVSLPQGRGELQARQMALGQFLKKLHQLSMEFNFVAIMTNQVSERAHQSIICLGAQGVQESYPCYLIPLTTKFRSLSLGHTHTHTHAHTHARTHTHTHTHTHKHTHTHTHTNTHTHTHTHRLTWRCKHCLSIVSSAMVILRMRTCMGQPLIGCQCDAPLHLYS